MVSICSSDGAQGTNSGSASGTVDGEVAAPLATVQPTPAGDDDLVAREKDLTKEVPVLLDSMNRAASEVNVLERQLGDSQERHRRLLEQWSRLYEDLRRQYGPAIDGAKPYFDAAEVLSAASHRAQSIVREFSAAASQHSQAKAELRCIEEGLAYGAHKVSLDRDQQENLSRATVNVLRCQQIRDKCEQEYANVLQEFQEAQEVVDARRGEIGEAAIRRTAPCFRKLQQHQLELAAEQNRIKMVAERTRIAKHTYHSSMRELDRINVSVHKARSEHVGTIATGAFGDCLLRERAAPEVSPEAEAEDGESFAFGEPAEVGRGGSANMTKVGRSSQSSFTLHSSIGRVSKERCRIAETSADGPYTFSESLGESGGDSRELPDGFAEGTGEKTTGQQGATDDGPFA